jgi:aminopeptidase N
MCVREGGYMPPYSFIYQRIDYFCEYCTMIKRFLNISLLLLTTIGCFAQQYPTFTHADTLRGKLTPLRTCYDVYFYNLHLKIDTSTHSISGYNVITYRNVTNYSTMQVDLFSNMIIDSILHGNYKLSYSRDGNAVFIKFNSIQQQNKKDSIRFYYHGVPQIAKNPPWDGGFVWSKDSTGKPWIDVACEGTGASLWWPCKDHLSDKPDSMRMSFDIPNGLMCVSNGRLRSTKNLNNGYTRFTWFVSTPIINYDVTLNIADYAHISDYYINKKDTLTLDYYVLRYNENKALTHFAQVKPMLACYEKFFGKYPFYKDGYKLVETTYWGMEHQSCVAYGNQYHNNSFGFDFIIIHESAHEWWGNSVSCSDPADMWIHEAFATYAEALYLECTQNYTTAVKYLHSQEKRISNKYPIIGPYDVNFQGTANDDDMYFKGTWMLQTFRHVINNDSLFFSILQGIQMKFYHANTNTDEVISYINKIAGKDYTPFFNQYLHYASPPVFEYKLKQKGEITIVTYRWDSVAKGFEMPLKVTSKVKDSVKTYITITPGTGWKTIRLDNLNASDFSVDIDEFYSIPKREEE